MLLIDQVRLGPRIDLWVDQNAGTGDTGRTYFGKLKMDTLLKVVKGECKEGNW